jgi:hypothetical protein
VPKENNSSIVCKFGEWKPRVTLTAYAEVKHLDPDAGQPGKATSPELPIVKRSRLSQV